MTFSIQAAGTKEQVRAQIEAQREQHKKWNNDPAQIDAVAALIEHHLSKSAYAGGVHVEASGHHDAHSGNLELKIRSLNIPPAPVEPEREQWTTETGVEFDKPSTGA